MNPRLGPAPPRRHAAAAANSQLLQSTQAVLEQVLLQLADAVSGEFQHLQVAEAAEPPQLL